MAKVHEMITRSNVLINTNSAVVSCQRLQDEEGAVQAECSGGSYRVVVQGKVQGAGFSWMDLTDASSTDYDVAAGESKIFTGIPILPRMRVRVINPTTATLSIFFME